MLGDSKCFPIAGYHADAEIRFNAIFYVVVRVSAFVHLHHLLHQVDGVKLSAFFRYEFPIEFSGHPPMSTY